MKTNRFFLHILLFLLLLTHIKVNGQDFEETFRLDDFATFYACWVDTDNDGDLDILTPPCLFENDGAGFIYNKEFGLGANAVETFDIDHDGDMDLVTDEYIYINDGNNSFSTIELGLGKGVLSCGDLDNDGLEDILHVGRDEYNDKILTILKNNGDLSFSSIEHEVIPISESEYQYISGSVRIFDFDKDQRNDLLLSGTDFNGIKTVVLYKNNGGFNFEKIKTFEPLSYMGNISIADFDNNGWMDFALTGDGNPGTIIEEQTAANLFVRKDYGFIESRDGRIEAVNFDGDEDTDLMIVASFSNEFKTVIYVNEGSSTCSVKEINDFRAKNIAPGDYDNNSSVDLYLTAEIGIDSGRIYRNTLASTNAPPSVPTGSGYYKDFKDTYLYWSPSSDDQTPGISLTYNVSVRRSDGEIIVDPSSDLNTGFHKEYAYGNAGNDTLFMLYDLPPGEYYFRVQALDNCNNPSAFSTETQFFVPEDFSKVAVDTLGLNWAGMKLCDYDGDKNLEALYSHRGGDENEYSIIAIELAEPFSIDTIYKQEEVYAMVLHDINNDNMVDLLVDGDDYLRLLTNQGDGTFLEKIFPEAPIGNSVALAADLTNDGFIDIAAKNHWYRHDGNLEDPGFIWDEMLALEGQRGAAFDYNNDHLVDFVSEGAIYQNADGIFERVFSIPGIDRFSTVSPSDIDADGDLDFTYAAGGNIICMTEGDTMFSFLELDLVRQVRDEVFLGDFNSNGKFDLFVGGPSGNSIGRLYYQDSYMKFTDSGNRLPGVNGRNAEFGDIDNDGDLDIVLIDGSGVLYICYNNYAYQNNRPLAPGGLNTTNRGPGINLDWEPAVDDHTSSQSLSYNIRVGSAPGGTDIVSPLAATDGTRYIVDHGNTWLNTSWHLDSLPLGTYYWSVQAIDGTYLGSEWADEASFNISFIAADYTADTVCFGMPTEFKDNTYTTGDPLTSWSWDFGDGYVSSEQNPEHTYATSGTYSVQLIASSSLYSDSTSKDIVVRSAPMAEFTSDIVCQGSPTGFTNTSDKNGFVITSWQWEFGDGNQSTLENPGSHGYLNAGTYDVNLTITAENTCSDTYTKPVIVGERPGNRVYANGSLNFCEETGSVELSVEYSAQYEYTWSLNGIPYTGANTEKLDVSQGGTYTVEIRNTIANCLSVSEDVIITTNQAPEVPLLLTENYIPGQCNTDDPIIISVDQPVQSYSYTWFRNGVRFGGESGLYLSGYLPEGEYTVVASNGECPTSSAPQVIYFENAPEKPHIFVYGPDLWYLAANNDSAFAYIWYHDDKLIEDAEDYIYVAGEQNGRYRVAVVNEFGCVTISDEVAIPTNSYEGSISTFIKKYHPQHVDIFNNLKIYPNPTPGLFTLEMHNAVYGDLIVDIFSEQGAKILNIQFNKTTMSFKAQIDLSGQPAGVYLIGLMLENYKTSKQLVVE